MNTIKIITVVAVASKIVTTFLFCKRNVLLRQECHFLRVATRSPFLSHHKNKLTQNKTGVD